MDKILTNFDSGLLTGMILIDLQKSFDTINHDILLTPLPANVPILYPLKTSENQRFSGVFRGHKMETLTGNGFKKCLLLDFLIVQ